MLYGFDLVLASPQDFLAAPARWMEWMAEFGGTAEGVEAIAVCFLFSYIDPRHEERAREIIGEVYPEAFVTTSSRVSPQFREFERFTTAAMNAFIGPRVKQYVSRLGAALGTSGLGAELHIMASNGGVATPAMVAEKPVLTLLSGPAAGVLGGAWTGHGPCGRRQEAGEQTAGDGSHSGPLPHGATFAGKEKSSRCVSPSFRRIVRCCDPSFSCQASITYSPAGRPRRVNDPSSPVTWWNGWPSTAT